MKVDIKLPTRLLYNHPVILVTSKYGEKKNVLTVSWHTPVSNLPPQVAISIGKTRYSRKLIEKSGYFVINVPNYEMLEEVNYFGSVSGRDVDKFKERNVKISETKNGNIIIDDCVAYLECKVIKKLEVSDHIIFVGEVIEAKVEKELFKNNTWNLDHPRCRLIFYLGSGKYIF